jgi:hypothetical protein
MNHARLLAFLDGLKAEMRGLLFVTHAAPCPVWSWLGYSVCATISIAGATVVAKELKYLRVASGLTIVILLGMQLIVAWLALGAGPRHCFFRGPILAGMSPDWLCRGVFGFGAVMLAGMLVIAGLFIGGFLFLALIVVVIFRRRGKRNL